MEEQTLSTDTAQHKIGDEAHDSNDNIDDAKEENQSKGSESPSSCDHVSIIHQ